MLYVGPTWLYVIEHPTLTHAKQHDNLLQVHVTKYAESNVKPNFSLHVSQS